MDLASLDVRLHYRRGDLPPALSNLSATRGLASSLLILQEPFPVPGSLCGLVVSELLPVAMPALKAVHDSYPVVHDPSPSARHRSGFFVVYAPVLENDRKFAGTVNSRRAGPVPP